MKIRRIAARAVCAATLLSCWGVWTASAQEDAARIPWTNGLSFSRTSVDDDLRNVLRAILSASHLSVVFRPGVGGKVSLAFHDMNPQTAFDQLIAENGLQAAYSADTRTVTVGPAVSTQGNLRRFVPLQNVEWSSLRQMLVNFGIGTDGIAYDPHSSLLGVTGDPAHVAQVEDLVRTLEQHFGNQHDQELADTQHSAGTQQTDFERHAYQDALNVQTKVFRLRFADVGPTTRNFHGRAVTIPGILETLQAMLGTVSQAPPFSTQSTAPNVFTPSIGGGSSSRQLFQGQPPQGSSQSAGTGPGPATADLAGMATIGKPTFSIDQRTNSVIVRGSPAAIAAVADVLRQIDQPVKMVEIEVIIATAELGVVNQLGVAYRGTTGGGGAAFDSGSSGGVLGQVPGYNALTLLPNAAAGATVASFVLHGSGTSIQAQLQALASENKARVLSAPHLVTLDNITARITRSEDIYVPVDTGGLNGQGLSQIQTGLTLEITPSIVPVAPGSPDQLVRLTLDATNSAPGSGTGNQINVNSQEVQTDVLVPDGGTFVIGGLFDDSRLKNTSGIPVLKNIPLLGQLFRTDNSQQSLGQTIFLITPHVVDQQQLVARDVALGSGTASFMSAEARRLGVMARDVEGATGRASATL